MGFLVVAVDKLPHVFSRVCPGCKASSVSRPRSSLTSGPRAAKPQSHSPQRHPSPNVFLSHLPLSR